MAKVRIDDSRRAQVHSSTLAKTLVGCKPGPGGNGERNWELEGSPKGSGAGAVRSFSFAVCACSLDHRHRSNPATAAMESVQCFGRKKTAVAVTYCKRGRGLIKINGCPIELVEPEILRYKAFEPILLLGRQRFAGVDMRIRVKGGGHTSQIYAIRQSIAKALVAFYQKFVDEQSKKEIKDILLRYDRTLLVADPRRCEPKKFGGRGARSRFQKSYR